MSSFRCRFTSLSGIFVCCTGLLFGAHAIAQETDLVENKQPLFEQSLPLSENSESSENGKNAENGENTENGESAQVFDKEELTQRLEQLQSDLTEREIEHGPYHVSISEKLVQIAAIYFALEDHKQARSSLQRALEVQRISEGLYGAGQITIVQRLLVVNRTLEKWTDVNKNFEFLYWLHQRTYGESAVQLIPFIKPFIEWKIEAINGGLTGNRASLIRDALKAAKLASTIIEDKPELQHMASYYNFMVKSLRDADQAEATRNGHSF